MLKTPRKVLCGLAAAACCLSAAISSADPFLIASQGAVGLAVTAQTGASSPAPDAGARTNDLLRRARQAMAENNLDAAETLIVQAESLGVKFSPLTIGDTPAKARRDLQRMRESHSDSSADQGNLLTGLGLSPGKPSTANPFPLPAGADAGGSHPLLESRRALARGDVRHAKKLLSEASSPSAVPAPAQDGRERVAKDIQDYESLVGRKDAEGTQGYRRQFAKLMLTQAEALLEWGDLNEAERLTGQAADQRVMFSQFELTPEKMVQRIAQARRPVPKPGAPGDLQRLPNTVADASAKQKAERLLRQARAALASGNVREAELYAQEAAACNVPESAFGPHEDSPGRALAAIARGGHDGGVVQASMVTHATGAPSAATASQAYYDRSVDRTQNISAAYQNAPGNAPSLAPGPPQPGPLPAASGADASPPLAPPSPAGTNPEAIGRSFFEQGLAALRAQDTAKALDLFRQASAYGDHLDPQTRQRLQDHIQLLAGENASRIAPGPGASMAAEATTQQQVLVRQIVTDLGERERQARQLRETDPNSALALLEEARTAVDGSGVESEAKSQLLRRVDRSIDEMRQFIRDNQGRIALAEYNNAIRQDIEMGQQKTLDTQQKLAELTAEFNQLMEERRFAEAEVVAKRAAELDPDSVLARQLVWVGRFIRRKEMNESIAAEKEDGFIRALTSVDRSSAPFDDSEPYVFPMAERWAELTQSRARFLQETKRYRSERELEIERKLKTPVLLQFENRPLSEVIDYLGKLTEVNMYLDPQGLEEQGATTDTPVTINLTQEISLASALKLILQPLRLSYINKDEVLKITSEQIRDDDVFAEIYNVADLVIPIPNFVPSNSMGLQSALQDAYGSIGFGSATPFGGGPSPISVVAGHNPAGSGRGLVNPAVLAQMSGRPGSPAGGGTNAPIGFGPGGMGGGAQADFDSLIELIQTTIQPTTWDNVGGPGSIAPFETNLSLVVSQTQEVHEEIRELLEQLRRLQDLQVTIEVRFITLNDNFFERIGVDFDFDIDDDIDRPFQVFGRKITEGTGGGGDDDDDDDDTGTGTTGNGTNNGSGGLIDPIRDLRDVDHDRSVVVGMSAPGVFSADLDIPFTQNSYGLAIPQFGGFDAAAGASMGFAILSDIEAYFFMNAAQGDKRTNVLQAPKVTLFNGQQAFVSDTSQSPFVISVIPVVGDFAAAQQPVIVVLSEGTFLTVQAVVSNDRRFVRLTVVPFFSQIGDVNTFTFEGSQTSTTSTSGEDEKGGDTGSRKAAQRTTSNSVQGTTVQLPTFSFITVTTTVSVPDGGTVLLGGIKRLSEGRNEYGVPILNKLPYINRLFKNVGIGRETQSLMMMVTPRIIIPEEEEENIGIMR